MVFSAIRHKNFLPIWYFIVVAPLIVPVPIMSTNLDFFLLESSRVSTNQINWTFFTQFFKILMHFHDRGGRICFLEHHVIPLKIVAQLNYFKQNFHLEKIFLMICNKMHLFILNFKVAPIYLPRGAGTTSVFASTDSSLKTLNILFFIFRSKVYFSRYLAFSIFLLRLVCLPMPLMSPILKFF